MNTLDEYLKVLETALRGIERAAFERMVAEVKRAQAEDRAVYVCGNGGSAATASHMVNDIVKAPALATGCRPIRVHGLADCIPLMTALANDFDYSEMFSKQLEGYGRAGDVLIAISASGNSPNILAAVTVAKKRGITTIGLTGYAGGKLGEQSDVHVNVPTDNIGVAEDGHLILQHAMVEILKATLHDAPKA